MIFTLISQFGSGFTGPGVGPFSTTGVTTQCSRAATTNLNDIISLIIGFLTVLAGITFLLYFIFAALQWTSAGGDTGKVDNAKKQMTNGAIGLIIIVVSYGIMAVIGTVVGLDILNPGVSLGKLSANANCATNYGGSAPAVAPPANED